MLKIPKQGSSSPANLTQVCMSCGTDCKAAIYKLPLLRSATKGWKRSSALARKPAFSRFTPSVYGEMLAALHAAAAPDDLARPSWRLHGLSGRLAGFHAMTVQANWRLVFRFDGTDVELLDHIDYH